MFKRNVLAVSMTLAALCSAQAALADINGGGATLPQALYQTSGVLTAGFAPYIGVGSGNGNVRLPEQRLHQVRGWRDEQERALGRQRLQAERHRTVDLWSLPSKPAWGKLIQVPSVGTSVAIPFRKSGANVVDLSIKELCGVFSGRVTDWSGISGAGRTESDQSGLSQRKQRHH